MFCTDEQLVDGSDECLPDTWQIEGRIDSVSLSSSEDTLSDTSIRRSRSQQQQQQSSLRKRKRSRSAFSDRQSKRRRDSGISSPCDASKTATSCRALRKRKSFLLTDTITYLEGRGHDDEDGAPPPPPPPPPPVPKIPKAYRFEPRSQLHTASSSNLRTSQPSAPTRTLRSHKSALSRLISQQRQATENIVFFHDVLDDEPFDSQRPPSNTPRKKKRKEFSGGCALHPIGLNSKKASVNVDTADGKAVRHHKIRPTASATIQGLKRLLGGKSAISPNRSK